MNIVMLNPGVERQVGTALEDIRDDHKERYLWASERLAPTEVVLDAGCGVGYGSTLLALGARSVHAIDISEDAVAYAKKYWAAANITHAVEDLCFFSVTDQPRYDAIVAFEVIEHLIEPRLFLLRAFEALKAGGRIFLSVPNEKVIPHTVNLNPFHLKHYTPDEVHDLLSSCGFEVKTVASQNTKEITEGNAGRFLILEAKRKPRRTDDLDHGALSQYALLQAANFVVARAMAIHKATKDNKTLKLRAEEASRKLDEVTRALSATDPRSETQLKLLQFVEGLQAQTNTSKDLLVSDLMRRVRELESFERELRERVTQSELQRTMADEALRYTQEIGRDRAAAMEQLSADLTQARAASEAHLSEGHRLKDGLRQLELQRVRAEDAHQHSQQKLQEQAGLLEQLTTELTKAREQHQVLVEQLEHVQRDKAAQADAAVQGQRDMESELSNWKGQLEAAQHTNSTLGSEISVLQASLTQLQAQRDQLVAHTQQLQHDKDLALAQLQGQITELQLGHQALFEERESLRSLHQGLSAELAQSQRGREEEREAMATGLSTAQKLASDAKAKRDAISARLLAIGRDNAILTSANEDLTNKLQASEAEAARLLRNTRTLQAELQSASTTVAKAPPTLGNIYKKLRFHRFYLPFFYKAMRNSMRNQAKRFRAKA